MDAMIFLMQQEEFVIWPLARRVCNATRRVCNSVGRVSNSVGRVSNSVGRVCIVYDRVVNVLTTQ